MPLVAKATALGVAAGSIGLGYLGLVTGALSLDLGVGRGTRRLGPITLEVDAPREVLFDVIALPYAERTTRAMQAKVRVLQRGTDMVLAAHYTPVRGRLSATTVETVRFARPDRVEFRLVRGPVPHVVESFELRELDGRTQFSYVGELGTDLWAPGRRWGDLVAAKWEAVVAGSMAAAKAEAERQANGPMHQEPT